MTRVKTKTLSFVTAFMLVFALVAMLPQGTIRASAQTVKYDLKIAGTQVTSVNASDVLGGGEASYDAAINTLTLKKDITASGYNYCVDSDIEGLKINVVADITLKATDIPLVCIDTTIKGSGKLTTISTGNTNTGVFYGTCTIDGIDVNMTGKDACYIEKKLIVRNANLTVTLTGYEGSFGDSALYIVDTKPREFLTLQGCKMVTPADGKVAKMRDWGADSSIYGIADGKGNPARTIKIEQSNVTRLAGNNRYETAVKISQATYTTSDYVILTNGLDFADALAGVPLAQKLNAPILLTPKNMLHPVTLTEIKRLGAKHIIILGGVGAVSDEVANSLSDVASEIDRIEGSTRYGTSIEVAKALNDSPEILFFACGNDYADALSVSPYAAGYSAPIIYLPKKGNIPAETKDYLAKLKDKNCVKQIYTIGGTGAVSDETAGQAIEALGINIDNCLRLAGENRYETCVAVNSTFAEYASDPSICIATGADFPDALAGGVFAAKNKSPLFLVNGKLKTPKFNDLQLSFLKEKKAAAFNVFGGTGVVSDEMVKAVVNNSK